MRAMVLRGTGLAVEEVATPQPGPGLVLARVLACGICGSDLHMALYGEQMAQERAARGERGNQGMDFQRGVVMGHEYVARVEALGEGVEHLSIGQRVTSIPVLTVGGSLLASVGYSSDYPGGYGEYVILAAELCLPVPDSVPDTIAATTEPCAVGLHAVNAANVQPGEQVLVMGAGPIGLMSLLWLRQKGVEDITVSDPAPARRELAARLGATRVVDPAAGEVVEGTGQRRRTRPEVVIEAVGVAGTIQQAMELVGSGGRIVVAGACMTEDTITPMTGIGKQLSIRFVLGYTPQEFADTLAALADGSVDTAPLITQEVDLDGLPDAFRALSRPEECKVIVRP